MRRLRGTRTERGITSLLVAILAVVLFGCLAFVSDFGFAYANQRRIQNGADAAALAVGRKIATTAGATDACATVALNFNNAATRAIATNVFSQNVGAGAQLAAGAAGFEVKCETVGTNPTVVVKVAGQQSSPSFLGGIFGRTSVPVGKTARTIVGPLGSVIGLRPFAICEVIANQVASNPGTTFVVPVTQANAGCGTAPGNWAMMDFNGGSNPTDEMKNWILNGNDQPVNVNPPLLMNGDPGFNVNSAETEMNAMFALDDIALPVYNSVTGNGNNAEYNIVGFISVTPCRYKINNKIGPAPGDVNPGCAALPVTGLPDDYLQLKYSSYVPIGDVSLTCAFGNNVCDNGPRGTTLAD